MLDQLPGDIVSFFSLKIHITSLWYVSDFFHFLSLEEARICFGIQCSPVKHLVRKHGYYKRLQNKRDATGYAVIWRECVCFRARSGQAEHGWEPGGSDIPSVRTTWKLHPAVSQHSQTARQKWYGANLIFSHSGPRPFPPLSLWVTHLQRLPSHLFPHAVYFWFMSTIIQSTSSMFPCVPLQVRSGWPLSCTGTWAPTCPQRMPAWDWARQSTLITLLSSTPQSSRHQLTRRPIRFTCLSPLSSLSNTCR